MTGGLTPESSSRVSSWGGIHDAALVVNLYAYMGRAMGQEGITVRHCVGSWLQVQLLQVMCAPAFLQGRHCR